MKSLIVDDHQLFAEGLKQVLSGLAPDMDVDIASTIEEGFALAKSNDPDLVIFDLYMPDSQGIPTLKLFVNTFRLCPVLVVSACDHGPTIQQVLDSGAMGFVSKASPLSEMHHALQCVLAGDIYTRENGQSVPDPGVAAPSIEISFARKYRLTPRQVSVLNLMQRGLTNREIASVLCCTEGTVKIHVSNALKALGVKNRTEAVWVMTNLSPV